MVLAATIICGAMALTSCSSNDDNPATPDLGVKEKIIGKWMRADVDGQILPTNEKEASRSCASGGRLPASATARCSGPPCAKTPTAPPPSKA